MTKTADVLSEMLSVRVPAGTGRMITDVARRQGLSRSDLMRLATLAYIKSHSPAEEPA